MFYNPGLAMSFTQLIYGGESTDFERAFAEGIGLVGGDATAEEEEQDRDEEAEERASSNGSSARRMKVQLKLISMKSEQFDRLEVQWPRTCGRVGPRGHGPRASRNLKGKQRRERGLGGA